MSKRHQEWVFLLLESFEPGETVDREFGVPELSRSVDGRLVLGQPSDAWGVLRADVTNRALLIEHFSKTPNRKEMAGCWAELAWADELWQAGNSAKVPKGRRRPLMLVFCSGKPTLALEAFGPFTEREIGGVYHKALGPGCDMLVVDVTTLQEESGTSALRLLTHIDRIKTQHIDELIKDRALADDTRERILEAIMRSDSLPADVKQYTARELREKGREEGRLEERHQLLTTLLAKRIGRSLEEHEADALNTILEREGPDEIAETLLEMQGEPLARWLVARAERTDEA